MMLTLAVAAAGCGSPTEPPPPMSDLTLILPNQQRDPTRYVLVEGDIGNVVVRALGFEPRPCSGDGYYPPGTQCGYSIELSVEAEVRSSDTSVVSPVNRSGTTPFSAYFRGLARGSAVLTVSAQGFEEEVRVEVVAPPPGPPAMSHDAP